MTPQETNEMARLQRDLNIANKRYEILRAAMTLVESHCASTDVQQPKILMLATTALSRAAGVGKPGGTTL